MTGEFKLLLRKGFEPTWNARKSWNRLWNFYSPTKLADKLNHLTRKTGKVACRSNADRFIKKAYTSLPMALSVEVDCVKEWSSWIATYGKHYSSEDELRKRQNIWRKKYEEIQEHNSSGKYTYRISLTRFSDQEQDELSWMNGLDVLEVREVLKFGDVNKSNDESKSLKTHIDNPKSVDWRAKGCVTPVQNQMPTHSCWIFSAVAAVESHHKIKNGGELLKLSEKQLINDIENGDKEGRLNTAFEHIKKHGIAKAEHYSSSERKRKDLRNAIGIKGWERITNSEKSLETIVANEGPVAVSLIGSSLPKFRDHICYDDIFYDPDWNKVLKFIFEDNGLNKYQDKYGCMPLLHTVLVVGYGEDANNNKYWIVKNSWGVDEKEDEENGGYKKIAKDRDNNCCIAGNAMYPTGVHVLSSDAEPQKKLADPDFKHTKLFLFEFDSSDSPTN